jgi:carbon-monoxide dehydrogenase large subunit
VGTATHGQSLETTLAQVVADHLGVDVDDVSIHQGDTDAVPYGQGTGGSRSAVMGGAAVAKAATELRSKVVAVAAHLLEADPNDLVTAGGAVSVRGTPSRSLSFADVATAAYANGALPASIGPGLEVVTRHESALPFTLANACHMCACEVDVDTGLVTIVRYAVSEDCGVMINPMVVEGQIAGGVVQGVAGVLYEHLVIDGDGTPRTTTLADYLLPAATDVPVIRYGHVETPSPSPGGFKGMGEGGVLGSVPAVFNAVSDALAPLGIVPTRQPLGPSEIVDLLVQADDAGKAGDLSVR